MVPSVAKLDTLETAEAAEIPCETDIPVTPGDDAKDEIEAAVDVLLLLPLVILAAPCCSVVEVDTCCNTFISRTPL